MTKEELKKYVKMDAQLKRLEQAIAETRSWLEKPSSTAWSFSPSSAGRKRDLSDGIAKLEALLDDYNARWDALIDERARIEAAIAAIADPVEQALLGYRYVDGLQWEQICVKLNYSWAQTHRVHASALKNIAEPQSQ